MTFSAVWGLLGFGGVAVSLGLKDVVSDFIAGVILMVNPTFKVGDTVSLALSLPSHLPLTLTIANFRFARGACKAR